MSFVNAAPEVMGTTATNLAGIGATISAANANAATPTTALVASAQDQVSAAVATFFNGHAQGYQTVGAQAAAFHQNLVQVLKSGAGAYATAETDNAATTGNPTGTPAEQTNRRDNPLPKAKPESSMDGNRATGGSGATAGMESRSGVTGLIGLGGARAVGVTGPVVEPGLLPGAMRVGSSGIRLGADRIVVSGPRSGASESPSAMRATAATTEPPARLITPAGSRGNATVVTLNARGGGSGGLARSVRHAVPGRSAGGAGGFGARESLPSGS